MREFLEEAFGYVGLDWNDYVRIDQRYYRPTEVDYLLADTGKAQKTLNWKPRVHFHDLVRVMVDADMELAGLSCPGDGHRISSEHLGDWHRWESQVISMDTVRM